MPPTTVAIERMGLGEYGGPAYNQGYRDRDGWAGEGTLGNQEARLCVNQKLYRAELSISLSRRLALSASPSAVNYLLPFTLSRMRTSLRRNGPGIQGGS